MNIWHIIAAILGSVVFWAGQKLDLITSVRGEFYGTSESTKFLRNEDGDIDATRKWIISGVFFALGWLIFLFIHQIVGILWLFGLGLLATWQAWENDKKQKKNRIAQIAWLTRTAQYTPDQAGELFLQQHFEGIGALREIKPGVWYFSLFKWITAPTPEILYSKLIQHALKPANQWFTEGK